MGKEKSVKNEVDTSLLEDSLNTLKNIKSHYMSLLISTEKIDDNDWKAKGVMKLGSSLDGERWGEMEIGVLGYDVNSDSALATVMVSLNNFINSPEFVIDMSTKMKDALEGEAKLPEILAT